jgi:membrane-associated protease RseP (regulator of RpoE activity)
VIFITPIFLWEEMEEEIRKDAVAVQEPLPFYDLRKIWLNVLLFVVTAGSAFFVGFSWSINYVFADEISRSADFAPTLIAFLDFRVIILSMIYAVTLIGILLGHELGHFLTCRYYKIDATLPYFIPFPNLIGTLGAFIKIKSRITRKKQLFDIGVAGPLTSFFLSVPLLVIGLSLSKAVPSVPRDSSIIFGEPLLLKIVGGAIFKGISSDFDIILHPIGFAAWVGILVTALNLFPIGQLDGGHIFYAFVGRRSKNFSRYILMAFIIMGIFFWVGWLVWAALIAKLGLKHPQIVDEDIPLPRTRRIIGYGLVIIFILSFIPDPIKGMSLFDLVGPFFF